MIATLSERAEPTDGVESSGADTSTKSDSHQGNGSARNSPLLRRRWHSGAWGRNSLRIRGHM